MTVKIQVTDADNRPVAKAEVFVKWQSGGFSKEYTNASGIADLKCSGGTIEYIQVWGEQVCGKIRVDDNQTIEVSSNKH